MAARAVEMKATVRGAAKTEGLKVAAVVATRVVVVVGAMAAGATEVETLETAAATAEVVARVASEAAAASQTAAASHPATLLMVTPMMMAPDGAASTAANQVPRQAAAHSLPMTSSRSAAYAKEQSARFSSRIARSSDARVYFFRRAECAYSSDHVQTERRSRPSLSRARHMLCVFNSQKSVSTEVTSLATRETASRDRIKTHASFRQATCASPLSTDNTCSSQTHTPQLKY